MDYSKLICKYDDDQLDDHVEKFLDIVRNDISGERSDQLIDLYTSDPYKEQLRVAPASSVGYFHNAFIGGYCLHVMNVIENAKAMFAFYSKKGGIIDFELEELVFAAMHHDLGKLGDETGPYYVINDEDWSLKKRQMFFKRNPDVQNMDPGMRGFYVLNQFGIKYSWKEMLGIRLADGLYEECNKEYLVQFDQNKQLKTNLPYLLHTADFLSSRLECDDYKKEASGDSVGSKELFG
jgi:hypothetical protein